MATPKAKLPDNLTIQVKCDKGHVLAGLFVLLKRDVPPSQGTDDEKVRQAVADATSTQPAPPSFELAFSNRSGYLEQVPEDYEPFQGFYDKKLAHSHSLQKPPGKYLAYFFRHPSVALARELLRIVNGDAQSSKPDYPGDAASVDLTVKKTKDGKDQLTIEIKEDPTSYVPRGADLYDGWMLYQDMPGAGCGSVPQQVERLQWHLGTLRYPIGAQESPYVPGTKLDPNIKTLSFDVVVRSAVHTLQTDASGRRPAALADVKATHEALLVPGGNFDPRQPPAKSSEVIEAAAVAWRYLNQRPLDASAKLPVPERIDGVVDASTGEVIHAWLEKGLCKPGPILVSVPTSEAKKGTVYLRVEPAVAVEAWRRVVKALGCKYGLASGHTFRHVTSSVSHPGRGVASLSLHKTGTAVDLSVNGSEGDREDYTRPIEAWPILFERSVDVADSRGTTLRTNSRMYAITWRLYGHSDEPFPLDAESARKQGNALAPDISAAAGDLTRELQQRTGLQNLDAKTTETSETSLPATYDAAIQRIEELAQEASPGPGAVDASPELFFERYFRPTVTQWNYDPYDLEGGTVGREYGPNDEVTFEYDPGYKVKPGGASFVNISAIAQRFGMLRIHAQASGWQDEAIDEKGRPRYVQEQGFAIHHGAKNNFTFVVQRLAMLKKSYHSTAPIYVSTDQDYCTSFHVVDADLDFMDDWDRFVVCAKRGKDPAQWPKHMLRVSIKGPEACIELGVGKAADDAREFLAVLRDRYAKRRFACIGGAIARGLENDTRQSEPGADEIATGQEWSNKIEAMLGTLASIEATRAPAPGQGTRTSKPKRQIEFTVTLLPLFCGSDEIRLGASCWILFPGMGTGRALEWWHYQHECANGQKWIDLVEAVGYSHEVLDKTPSASSYWRPGVGYSPPQPRFDNWDSTYHSVPHPERRVENYLRPQDTQTLFVDAPPPVQPKPKPKATKKSAGASAH